MTGGGFHVLKSKLIDIEYNIRTQNARVSNHLLGSHKTKDKRRILLSSVGVDFWHLALYFSLRNIYAQVYLALLA